MTDFLCKGCPANSSCGRFLVPHCPSCCPSHSTPSPLCPPIQQLHETDPTWRAGVHNVVCRLPTWELLAPPVTPRGRSVLISASHTHPASWSKETTSDLSANYYLDNRTFISCHYKIKLYRWVSKRPTVQLPFLTC